MNFTYMIMTILAAAALAKGAMECNLSEPTGVQQCLGALGEPLIFYLPSGTNKRTILTKNTQSILKITNNTVVINSKYSDHSAFFTNGTFKLEKVTMKDSGDYVLETYGLTDGLRLHKINFHIEIQAPVSEPAVSQMCLSPEQIKVSCSSEGDGLEFILTLDGQLLIHTKPGSTDKQHKPSVTIGLHSQLTGILTCNVRNNVSREETSIHLTSCKAPVSEPAVSQMCLSPEQMKVSCSSEGDGVEFILTLDRQLLIHTKPESTDKQHTPSVPNVTISLHCQLTGILTCNVRNNVSTKETFINLTSCKASVCHCIVAVRAGAVTLLLLALCLAVYYVQKKTRPKTDH